MCSLLSAGKISDALGEEVAVAAGSDTECTYSTDLASGDGLYVSSRRADATLEDMRGGFFEVLDTEVDGQAALFSPGSFSRELYVSMPAGGIYTLQVMGSLTSGIDAQAVMTGLAALALSRLAGIAPLATATPEPARIFTGDPEFEGLFPAKILGVPITLQTMTGSDFVGGVAPPALQAVLEDEGKTLDDVRVGIGFAYEPTSGTSPSIWAYQVQGTDMAAIKAALLPSIYEGRTLGAETTQQIGGKDVTSADLDGTRTYFYPRDDILWAVDAVEPALTEVFQNLP